ncbi:potassium-transporting ATPase subunit C [Corynebacterium sp. zg-331]|nr:potassium-transporting ATPase subunit C [Corynebacterium sp. zg-331]MPV52161.1 potassium-transporting ATPase subunit C [Corynebacterium sp. zg331]
MSARLRRTVRAGAVALAVFTLILGLCYPLGMVGFGALVLPHQAAGSLLYDAAGTPRGSVLLAQPAPDGGAANGPARAWFYPRPSAGEGRASHASPADPAYRETVEHRRREVAARESLPPSEVPPEALAASGSGLDPHVSRAYAEAQVPRVARYSGLPEETLRNLIARHGHGSLVNVTTLNAAVAQAGAARFPVHE